MMYAGSLTFDPTRDTIESFKFKPPTGSLLPATGFTAGDQSLIPSPDIQPQPDTEVIIDPNSSRLQELEPFAPFEGEEFSDIRVLFKVKGKCTTDHISAVGPWLKYKGHLENISSNTLIGATNAETGEVNRAYDIDGAGMSIPELAKLWKSRGQQWLVIGDQNYGEGSAREHAALQPRYLGGRILLCRSFARIHETNLKKQGILPLVFANEVDYDKISSHDVVRTTGIKDLFAGKGLEDGTIMLHVTKPDGSEVEIPTKHTMSEDQVAYFRAGSALSLVREHASKAGKL
jgi:aconitase A